MPQIGSPYSAQNSLADTLRDLGQSMFGDQALHEGQRQNAFKLQRQNQFTPEAADALARGDITGAVAAGVRAGMTGQDAANWNLLGASGRARGNIDDPNLATAQLGAHEPISSTAVGQGRVLTNERAINAARIAEQRYQFENAPEIVQGPNGGSIYTRRSDAYGQPAPMSEPQVLGSVMRAAMQPNSSQPAAFPAPEATPGVLTTSAAPSRSISPAGTSPGTAQPATMPAQSDPFANVPDWALAKFGILDQIREQRRRNTAAQSLPPPPTEFSQAALDARNTSGLPALIQGAVNHTVGFFGGPEVGADTNRARENLDQLALETRKVLSAIPGRSALSDRNLAMRAIPHPGMLGITGASGETEKNNVVTLTQHLRRVYGELQHEALSPGADPKQSAELHSHMQRVAALIHLWEAPPNSAATATQPKPSAGSAQAAPAQVPLPEMRRVGQIYQTPRGPARWMGSGWQLAQ
jgi:hypothetical protein